MLLQEAAATIVDKFYQQRAENLESVDDLVRVISLCCVLCCAFVFGFIFVSWCLFRSLKWCRCWTRKGSSTTRTLFTPPTMDIISARSLMVQFCFEWLFHLVCLISLCVWSCFQYSFPFDKRLPYDVDIRIPFIVRGPGVPKGKVRLCLCLRVWCSCLLVCRNDVISCVLYSQVSDAPVVLIDVAPTIIDMAEGNHKRTTSSIHIVAMFLAVTLPTTLDGRSIRPLFQSPAVSDVSAVISSCSLCVCMITLFLSGCRTDLAFG